MKKIGIMSMQRIINYGSFLQAYGLKKIIEELGGEVEFVDYHLGECLIKDQNESNKLKRIISKVHEALAINTSVINKIKFISYKKDYKKKYLPLLGITDNYIYTPSLDTLVIGSDEVFNCIQSNSNVGFSKELFGVSNKASRLISYAASFGNTTLGKLEKYGKKNEVQKYLSNFDAISVRDENSKNIVSLLLEETPHKNLDPVLMYDYMSKCDQIPDHVDIKKPYIILYGYSGRLSKSEAKIVEEFAKKTGKEIIFLGGIQHCKGKFIDCSPFKVLSFFKNADCIITDTFHGTIFSIINHKPFFTIVRKSKNNEYGNQEKLTDLLNKFDLIERAKYELKSLDDIYSKIDYKKIDEILEEERKLTYMYLKNNI